MENIQIAGSVQGSPSLISLNLGGTSIYLPAAACAPLLATNRLRPTRLHTFAAFKATSIDTALVCSVDETRLVEETIAILQAGAKRANTRCHLPGSGDRAHRTSRRCMDAS